MPKEVSGQEFFKSVTSTEPDPVDFPLVDAQNRKTTFTLEPVDRKNVFDELNRLPGGFIDVLMAGGEDAPEELADVDDPEDIDMDVSGSEILRHLDGTVIDVFETLFSMSAKHEDFTSMDIEEIAQNLPFEVLFDAGSEVINMSLSDEDNIKRFREQDSDKSS